jgi:phage-related protein
MADEGTIISNIYDAITSVETMVTKIKGKIGDYLDKSISSAETSINNLAVDLQVKTVKSIENMSKFLGGRILDVENIVSSVAQTVSNIEDTVRNITSDVVTQVASAIDGAVDKLKSKVDEIVSSVTDIVNQVKAEVQQASTNITIAIGATQNFLNQSITTGIATVTSGVTDLKDTVVTDFNSAKELAVQISNGILQKVEKSTQDLINNGKIIFDKTIDFVGNSITGLAQGFADLFENFQTFFSTIFSDFQKFIGDLLTIDEDAMYTRMARLAEKYKQVQNTIIPK